MHIFFSGIGGAAIGPLALIAHKAGFEVSGSDKQHNLYIDYLRRQGIDNIHIGQDYDQIAQVHATRPIDWFVYTSALPMEQPDAPELRFCQEHDIQATKRDIFLNHLLHEKNLKMIAIAGTHGKTTTTAMAIWQFKQLGIPISYSVGAKLSFGDMGEYDPASQYFIYEADEFDRNFLAFQPHLSIITGIDWDHPDIYPTQESYNQAFRTFLDQSERAVMWDVDAQRLELTNSDRIKILPQNDADIDHYLTLPGKVNRQDAWQVAHGAQQLTDSSLEELLDHLNRFPGVTRRFEQLAPNLYTDYAHTPPKIRGALQLAHEVAGQNVVVVYEGLHNTRQHFIREELRHLFDSTKQLYIVPSYLAREDPNLPMLSPDDLRQLLDPATQERTQSAALNDELKKDVQTHLDQGDLVLCLTAGGGKSLDEWLRSNFMVS
jgi:UDP-N-acetylmuramate--alanine ligase